MASSTGANASWKMTARADESAKTYRSSSATYR
jgi:hypothetical protein